MDIYSLFQTWLFENSPYILLVLVVLLVWDLVDLFVELGHMRFMSRMFCFYYFVRAFLSIAMMEMSIALELVNAEKKLFVAFVTPLIFSAMLQNLVVKIGGEKTTRLDFSKFFDDFRKKILESFVHRDIMHKKQFRNKLVESKIKTEEIERQCCVFAPTSEEFQRLKKALSSYSDLDKRVEYSKQLIEWGEIESAKQLLKNA